jgi:hypothetical protein
MLFRNSVRTSKGTPHFTITKINWLTLFKFNVELQTAVRWGVDADNSGSCARAGSPIAGATHPVLISESYATRCVL